MTSSTKTVDLMHDLESKLEARRADLRDLATMGAVVTSIHEIEAVLSVAMEMSVRLVNGEVGAMLMKKDGGLEASLSWGVQGELVKTIKYRNGQDIATYCFETQQSVILNDPRCSVQECLKISSVICVPIKTASRCFGTVIIFNKTDGGYYAQEDQEILEMLMNFVAVAIDNSILVKEKLQQQKVEQEMMIARQVQETILPGNIDSIEGADIGAIYSPARDVGGDFYDVVNIDEHQCVVIVGDVSNKGVPAALVMSAAVGIIKSAIVAQPGIRVSELAAKTNEMLASEIIKDREMFVTLFFGRFDFADRTLTYCNAGHIPGLFWDSRQGQAVELTEGGPLIGQFPGTTFKQGRRSFASGDRLLLLTDGLTEAADRDGQLFGRNRVREIFVQEIALSPKDFCLKIKERVDRFTEGCQEDTIDDFTVLQVKAL
ncbi:MAG: SpoIIE family protein phosphatase [Candidatus Zixiibacteriota bacterium]|nr:MAG: SpoIIE family protein phosphatase [candidate division Zixibacteria bacterium]